MTTENDQPTAPVERLVHTSVWTIEPHGNGYTLYSGRGPMSHGLNLVHMSEPDGNWEATKRLIEAAPEMFAALKAIAALDYTGGAINAAAWSAVGIAQRALKKVV